MGSYEVFNYAPLSYIQGVQYIPDATSKFVISKQELLRDELEHIARPRTHMLSAILIQLISNNMIQVTENFRNFAENLLPLCNHIIASIDLYLKSINIDVTKYLLDIYDLGEGEYSELKPFIEVHVYNRDIDEVLRIWRDTVNYLRSLLGDDILEYVDIFFTRAK